MGKLVGGEGLILSGDKRLKAGFYCRDRGAGN